MNRNRFSWFNATTMTLGFACLYLPIVLLITNSFNSSGTAAVWGGFSTKWYLSLLQNEAFIDAALMTLKVALLSATVATVLGTFAALVLVRSGRLFRGMVFTSLVMPKVIVSISLLLLCVAVGIERGFWTITAAHITFSICYVAIVVVLRLVSLDRSLVEAALDLGCTESTAFRQVTLPLIMPVIVAGWFLAFALSLGDLLIALLTSGSEVVTLPMKIYSSVQSGLNPEINALSTLLLAVVFSGVVLVSVFVKRSENRIVRAEQAAKK